MGETKFQLWGYLLSGSKAISVEEERKKERKSVITLVSTCTPGPPRQPNLVAVTLKQFNPVMNSVWSWSTGWGFGG